MGIAVVVAATAALSDGRHAEAESSPARAIVQLVVGFFLVAAVARRAKRRTAPGPPAWLEALTSMTPARTTLLGVGLSTANPVNFAFAAAAGVTIGSAPLSAAASVAVVAAFTVLAGLSVLVPVVAYLVAPHAMAGPLASLERWLTANGTLVTQVMLAVLGLVLIGKGISGLAG